MLISICHNFTYPAAFGPTRWRDSGNTPTRPGFPTEGFQTLLIPGYNNAARAAEESFDELALAMPEVKMAGLLWPGEDKGILYALAVLNADRAAWRVADSMNGTPAAANRIDFQTHSLGARVILGALAGGAVRGRHVLLTAPAVDHDALDPKGEFAAAAANCESLNIFFSAHDPVLRIDYPLGDFKLPLRQALGFAGPTGAAMPKNVRFFDCSAFVATHGGYRHSPQYYKAWRAILNGTAAAGLTVL